MSTKYVMHDWPRARTRYLADALSRLDADEKIMGLEFPVWFQDKRYVVEVRRDHSQRVDHRDV